MINEYRVKKEALCNTPRIIFLSPKKEGTRKRKRKRKNPNRK